MQGISEYLIATPLREVLSSAAVGGSDDQKRRLRYNAVTRAKHRSSPFTHARAVFTLYDDNHALTRADPLGSQLKIVGVCEGVRIKY